MLMLLVTTISVPDAFPVDEQGQPLHPESLIFPLQCRTTEHAIHEMSEP